jgi:glutamine amidotransferase-like uncharacterized protein
MKRTIRFSVLLFLTLALGACNQESAGPPSGISLPPDIANNEPENPTPIPEDPLPEPEPHYTTAVLLFNGSGVSTSDWQSTEQILKSNKLSYRLVNSSQMNAMTVDELADFGVIVVPGGSGGTITAGLTVSTRLRIRSAVRDYGVGYVGFCAGAWVAVGPEAETTSTASYGLAVAKGAVLPAYYPGGNTSLIADIVALSFADGSKRNMVWWGGPATPEWSGGVIARYVNGKPAISQTASGKGLVVISGPHPEAPQSWRGTAGTDPDGLDFDYAVKMIQAALTKDPLQTY